MTESTSRTARLEARIAPDVLSLVKRAAEIEGRSISDFVVAAARDAVRRTIADTEIIHLSRTAQEAFASLLLHPPKPTPALRKAFKRHRRLLRDTR